jgi:hypothetical protein
MTAATKAPTGGSALHRMVRLCARLAARIRRAPRRTAVLGVAVVTAATVLATTVRLPPVVRTARADTEVSPPVARAEEAGSSLRLPMVMAFGGVLVGLGVGGAVYMVMASRRRRGAARLATTSEIGRAHV